ncbi:hypothetical protein D4Z78_21070 [Okeania hirsuta]|nr:hypothetical protein D4Z78_21070 [Okeania hirsuta]
MTRTISLKSLHHINLTTAVILLIGATLRIYQFIFNRPLWLDEAMLAVNVIDRSYIDLLEPLEC